MVDFNPKPKTPSVQTYVHVILHFSTYPYATLYNPLKNSLRWRGEVKDYLQGLRKLEVQD